jgi:outer membrane receptor protein involved in Fe transport
MLFSPAASLIYLRNPKNTWRFSFSSAIRNPTLADQYLYYNVGRAILIGNINGVDSLITVESLRDFANSQQQDTLEYFNIAPIQPEQVRTLEAGYKGVVLKDKLMIDASYYVSFYTNFIGYKIGVIAEIDDTLNRIQTAQAYRVATNSKDLVLTTGAAIGLTYSLNDYFNLTGNYSWNELNRLGSDDPLIPAFNTPRHKFNLGLSGNRLEIKSGKLFWKKETVLLPNKTGDTLIEQNRYIKRKTLAMTGLSFNINFKWIEGFLFEGSPQFTGDIPSYYMLDAQLSKLYPKHGLTVKIGASNLTDNRAYQVYGGPQVGRLAYASILLDIK